MIEENRDAAAIAKAKKDAEDWAPGGLTFGSTTIDGYRLICTCAACPEQYDVQDSTGQQMGYLRLRHGHFRADVPDCGGETVYESTPKGDGIFEDDERMIELTNAVRAIDAWWDTLKKST